MEGSEIFMITLVNIMLEEAREIRDSRIITREVEDKADKKMIGAEAKEEEVEAINQTILRVFLSQINRTIQMRGGEVGEEAEAEEEAEVLSRIINHTAIKKKRSKRK